MPHKKVYISLHFPLLVNFQTVSPLWSDVACSELKNSAKKQLTNVWTSDKCKKLKNDFQNHRRELNTFWNMVC